MKAETVLDSVVFKLTPTRTRYDLVIIANGKTEKITSGLLDPFLAHLKTAKDQIAKGGYSIRLEPDPGTNTTWFTKDTVERFVRYVSTPEVLERVNTLELEILQINEAISIQGNGSLCSSIVEDHQSRWKGSMKGSKSSHNGETEKVMVLSKHGKYRRLSTGSITQEDNSRRQLMKVLESRKTVLRKEQGMTFARATAAGFNMDHMANLILFAKNFGASRLLEACLKFVDLWKMKHKDGQLLEAGAEAVPFRDEFTSMEASGIIFSGDDWKEKQFTIAWPVSCDNLAAESNEKDNQATISNTEDKRLSSDPQALLAPQHCRGQIQNPMLPQWASHGPPVSQSYPVQGMPYYQSYPASVSAFQSPYPSTDDPGLRIKTGLKSHSIDKVYNNESKNWEMNFFNMVSKDGEDHSVEFEKRQESHKKVSRSGKRRSSVIVVNNMKHNTTEGSDKSRSESQAASDVEFEEEIHRYDDSQRKHRNSSSSVNSTGGSTFIKTSNIADKDQVVDGQDGDTGNWQTFQKLLLRVQRESTSAVDRDMFSSEEPQVRSRVNKSQADPSIPPPRNTSNSQEPRTVRYDTETESGRSGYRRAKNDDFMIHGAMRHASSERSSNPNSQNEYQNASNLHKNSLCNVHDESFIVPFRPGLHYEVTEDRKTVMDVTDFHSAQKNSEYSRRTKNQHNYEPHVLSIMPDRGLQKGSSGFDQAKDFDMQISVQNGIKKETRCKEDVSKRAIEGLKGSGKERRSSSVQCGLEKRKMDPMTMKGKSSKLNPLADAKARAEKLRAFKADLQKAKKEKEEEERNRLEALKKERQKRIAARSSSSISQTPLNAPLTKARKPTRHSPSSCNGSKFSDARPRSLSPLSKLPSSKSPLSSQRIGASVTPKTSPYSYKSSKFSDAQPATSSPLLKLLRSNQNVGQSTRKSPEITVQKQIGLNPSSMPVKKLLGSSKNVAQSTSNTQETAAQKQIKFYSSSGKVSKFTDTTPSSSSPLQKLPVRTTSDRPLDSYKITKVDRLNGSAHLVRNESRQSASPISRLKKENNSLPLGSNAVSIQAKRVSDPKGIKIFPASSVRSVSSNQVGKKTMPKESQVKPKPATLSNRVGMSREPSGVGKKNPGMKERKNEIGGESSVTSESMKRKKANEVALELRNNEDDPIVVKAILILENKTTPAPTIRSSEVMVDTAVESCEGGRRDRIELVSEHPTGRSRVPLSVGEVDNSRECKSAAHSSSYEVVNPPEDVFRKFSNSSITEEPNQTRAMYIKEPTTSSIEHIEHVDQRVTMVGSQFNSFGSISVEQIHEVHEKPHTKGFPKGFKELLKFRRKGQNSASCELNADTSAVDVATVTRSSNNDPTLKDLIYKDSYAGSTPPKAYRSFSLFSPLKKNKSSEKKART